MITKIGRLIGGLSASSGVSSLQSSFPFIMPNNTVNSSVAIIPYSSLFDGETIRYVVPTAQARRLDIITTPQTNQYFYGVVIGNGLVSPTENDKGVNNQITSGFLSSSPSLATIYDSDTDTIRFNLHYTITNNGTDVLQVSELALFSQHTTAPIKGPIASGQSASRAICLDHTLLDSTVVIPVGDAGIIQYTFEYNFSME